MHPLVHEVLPLYHGALRLSRKNETRLCERQCVTAVVDKSSETRC